MSNKGMDAGKLTCKVIIQQHANPFDANGEPGGTHPAFATIWARIKTIGGGEKYINQQIVGEATHQLECRYFSGVTTKMRVLYGSRIFEIKQVIDLDMRHVEMWLICKEVPA